MATKPTEEAELADPPPSLSRERIPSPECHLSLDLGAYSRVTFAICQASWLEDKTLIGTSK